MKWTPIAQEIPKKNKTLIVTVKHLSGTDFDKHKKGNCWVSFAWLGSDEAWHYADNGKRMPREFRIIAWMEKPEPYWEENQC